ncbi:MAG: class I SAM-dependent methyltransferase [Actinomycetota bacterium]|nr:class I SAM-dependent methyltransferase [Actinomycetota bacterium]
MRWVLKAALQKALGALPQGERLNYVLQRRVLRTLPLGDAQFLGKVERALQHRDAYRQHGPGGRDLGDAVFYEFGAGWDLVIPLTYYALGVERQLLVDIRPSIRLELVNATIAQHARLRDRIEEQAGHELRPLGVEPIRDVKELERRFGITYYAPRDARETGLPADSVDFATSTDTAEHVPEQDLSRILAESRRLLRPDGALSWRVDMQDHYSYFDRSVSRYNFLRFSDRRWGAVNSTLHYQNRLRYPDYLRLVREAGFELLAERPSRPTEEDLTALRSVELARRFRDYDPDELGVKTLGIVARPLPDAS